MKALRVRDGAISLVKGLGFKARGAMLYRSSEDGREGILHVVYPQSGRGHLEGKFAINMGVFVPSVFRLEKATEPPRFPRIYDCQIVTRVSAFAGAGDIWWCSDDEQTLVELRRVIHADIPRFFTAWGDYSAIVERWKEGLPTRSVVQVSPLLIATCLYNQGKLEEAARILNSELKGRSNETAANRIRQFARGLELPLNGSTRL